VSDLAQLLAAIYGAAYLIADAQRDGATTPEAIAAHLTRMGVAVRA